MFAPGQLPYNGMFPASITDYKDFHKNLFKEISFFLILGGLFPLKKGEFHKLLFHFLSSTLSK